MTFVGKIESLSFRGLGITHSPEGKVYFVPYSWPGDELELEVTKEKKNFGEAKIVKILTPSPERRASTPCSYQGPNENQCGGCPWMIADYPAQVKEKINILKSFLHRYNLEPSESFLKEMKVSESEFGYKNRAQFKTDGTKVGFYAHETHKIIEIDKCLILNEKMNSLIPDINEHLSKIPKNSNLKHNNIPVDDSMSVGDLIRGNKAKFRQGHDGMNLFMKEWLEKKLEHHDKSTPVLELFAGSGNFTEVLVKAGMTDIIAVDYDQAGLKELEKALPNVKAKSANLFDIKSINILKSYAQRSQIIIADPPRKGIPIMEKLANDFVSVKDFIYISCNPDSMFKDLQFLLARRFKIREMQPLDAFPQNHHMEVMVHLSR